MATDPKELDRIAAQIGRPKTQPAAQPQKAESPLSFFRDLFVGGNDASAGGIARNTIAGIPRAARDVGADILRALPREGASIAASLPGSRETTPATDAQKFVFGEDPIKSLQTRTRETQENLQSFGVPERTATAAAPLGVGAMVALNVFPGTSGKGAMVKELVKETSEEGVKAILRLEGIPQAVSNELAPFIAKATDRKQVQELLRTRLAPKELPFEVPPGATPADAAVAKLAAAIGRAQTRTADIAATITEERGRRITEASKELAKGGDESAYTRALSKLKGQLADRTVFEPVRDQLTTREISSLFQRVNFHPNLNDFEKISIDDGLQKILRGELPEPKQLEDLEYVFGHELIRSLQSHSKRGAIYDNVLEAMNLPRTLMTGIDASAALRQGLVATFMRPSKVPGAFREMARQAFSPKNFDQWLDELKAKPEYLAMKRAGLYIPDPRDLAAGLTGREEAFMSRLMNGFDVTDADGTAKKIGKTIGNWAGSPYRASQRSYLAYLNKLRTDVFLDLSREFSEAGFKDRETIEALAGLVNAATGRGKLPGALGRAAPVLTSTFFSPRLMASRLTLLNPAWYAKQPAPVRKEAIKGMARMIGTGITILGLAKLGGADVEMDPRSTDFGKIKVGNTRWDIWGGFQQYVRVLAQLLPSTDEDGNWTVQGHKKTASGEIQELSSKQFPFTNRFDTALNFFLGKLAPTPSLAVQLLRGETPVGDELTPGGVALSTTIPLYLQDLKEAYDEGGAGRLVGAGIPGFFGVGTQTYDSSGGDKQTGRKIPTIRTGGSSSRPIPTIR